MRPHGPSQIPAVKEQLQARIHDLVRVLAPDGKLEHGYWIALNPTRADKTRGSFFVVCSRPGKTPGAWNDMATGDKGDVLDLVAYCRGVNRAGALDWAKKWLNFEALPPADLARARRAAAEREATADQIRARQLAENRARAEKLYRQSKLATFPGSVADLYLKSRGIDLARLPRRPGALGFLARARHTETDSYWPVMVAQMCLADGRTGAVHRTWLAPDGSGKAPVTPARKIWPSFVGSAIRLWRGETGMPVDEACRHGLIDTLALVEGIEDGLSVALARPDLRVWAAGSLGNLAHIPIPACAGEIIVCADNDWGKPQAERQLGEALRALRYSGRRVRVARSPHGKDMNDALNAGNGEVVT